MLLPGLSLEVLLLIDLMTRQGVKGQAIALIFVPPAGSWQGKAPNDGFIFVEQDEVALLCLLLKVGQLDAGLSQFMRIRVQSAGGSIITQALFFSTTRTLSRCTGTPVCSLTA